MAELLELSVEEIETLTTKNAKNLFKEFSSFC
jgi:Tat protein secretion system quality control protein TatD with DNase activity